MTSRTEFSASVNTNVVPAVVDRLRSQGYARRLTLAL